MLDTVVLTLDQREFEVLEPDRFSPSARGLIVPPYLPLGARGVFTCVQNPTKTDFAEGRYGPRLTLRRRKTDGGFALTLRIEFSAPKLVFGNNFEELRSRDFEVVLTALFRSLGSMGIRTAEETLRAARVSAIHYSKNMLLTDFTSCSMVMAELARLDLDARLDLAKTDYRNGGHAIRYHANSYEIVAYDKVRDLEKARYSEKRAIENNNAVQFDLLGVRKYLPRGSDILRLEIRLGTRQKIKDVMTSIGAQVEPTFAALFDISIAKDVLRHFWERMRSGVPLDRSNEKERPEQILARLAAANLNDSRPARLLQQLGLTVLVASIGPNALRALIGRYGTSRTWQRIRRQLKALPELPQRYDVLRELDNALTYFRPLTLNDFPRNATQGSVAPPSSTRARPARNGGRKISAAANATAKRTG